VFDEIAQLSTRCAIRRLSFVEILKGRETELKEQLRTVRERLFHSRRRRIALRIGECAM
jgi:hypothetical protein